MCDAFLETEILRFETNSSPRLPVFTFLPFYSFTFLPFYFFTFLPFLGNCLQFLGSVKAEVFEVVGRREFRSVEGRVERAIGFAIDIDVRTLVHVRVSLLSPCHLLLHGIFDEREVVVAIACYHSRQVFALRQSARQDGDELQVYARFRGRELCPLPCAVSAAHR